MERTRVTLLAPRVLEVSSRFLEHQWTDASTYRRLNATVVQPKTCPRVVNTKIELINITAASDSTGTLLY
jgi:hypothetical protein